MGSIFELIKKLLSDKYIFLLLQISFVVLFLLAVIREKNAKYHNPKISVKRGNESITNLYIAYGIASVIFIQIINICSVYNNHKVFISVINISILFYLCYFNSWFRNKIMNFFSLIKNKVENL